MEGIGGGTVITVVILYHNGKRGIKKEKVNELLTVSHISWEEKDN